VLTILRWSLVQVRYYWRQILWYSNGRLCDKESSADFYKVLNDDVLIDNIETNILKNIADNEARPELQR
jgi:hypothetical protein